MKKFLAEIQAINAYIWKHRILLVPILFYYINIIAISVLNGNWICVKKICGIGIADVLYHDPMWHMALTAQAFNSIPFRMPIFSGASLQGYHFLADFLYFLVSKIGFSPMVTYWKIMPHLFFIPFVYLTIFYARRVTQSVLFVFSYIVDMFLNRDIC